MPAALPSDKQDRPTENIMSILALAEVRYAGLKEALALIARYVYMNRVAGALGMSHLAKYAPVWTAEALNGKGGTIGVIRLGKRGLAAGVRVTKGNLSGFEQGAGLLRPDNEAAFAMTYRQNMKRVELFKRKPRRGVRHDCSANHAGNVPADSVEGEGWRVVVCLSVFAIGYKP